MENKDNKVETDPAKAADEQQPVQPADAQQNDDKWCFSWFADAPTATGANRAALVKGARWPAGSRITISFLDGDPIVQERVKKAALQWTLPKLANLSFVFRTGTNQTDIRISFRFAGSWSVIGTTCKQIKDLTQPTMNYGWLKPTSTDDELNRVVLHEFGHALGLIHEHQNPGGKIDWNREQVIKDLSGPPNNWTLPVIERNMFEPYAKNETNFTALDPKSIMMYPLPSKWTKNGFSVGLNAQLSDKDKSFIHQQYP